MTSYNFEEAWAFVDSALRMGDSGWHPSIVYGSEVAIMHYYPPAATVEDVAPEGKYFGEVHRLWPHFASLCKSRESPHPQVQYTGFIVCRGCWTKYWDHV